MLVLFSAGSLVALGGDALLSVLDGAQQGHVDVPAAISLGVSTLLVLCMDVAMLYAASMLRLLGMRRAEPRSMRLHRGVMATVAVLEAGTYAYMAWRYETPVSVVAWALILSRALAAPLLSVYLAMARPLPVTARDILAQVELASGLGLIRDAVTIANDASASLASEGRALRRLSGDDAAGSATARWLARGRRAQQQVASDTMHEQDRHPSPVVRRRKPRLRGSSAPFREQRSPVPQ